MPEHHDSPIPFPVSTCPGSTPQESGGRLVNCTAEPLEQTSPAKFKWSRTAGVSQHALTANAGYRGGLIVNNLSYECWAGTAQKVDATGNVTPIGPFPGTRTVTIARNQGPQPDVVAVDLDNGAYVLGASTPVAATCTATIGGTSFTSGDTVNLIFLNIFIPTFPLTISYVLGGGESANTVATALNGLINSNPTLGANNVSSSVSGNVLTISHIGNIGNSTNLTYGTAGSNGETITFNPASGYLTGGDGTAGAFSGVPTVFTGQGNLPQPNSVCFQDGYFFFTIGSNQCYATALNSLTVSPLTFITAEAKSDVQLLRGIPFNGLLLLFTTGHCEVWQDAANPAPNFPYSRIAVLEVGLAQSNAIAGYETGFSELLWVANDHAVHWMSDGGLTQLKVSPPDLDRLIEAEIRAGNTLTAGACIANGKKFWHLSSPNWTWEFNLQTRKWHERASLSNGLLVPWRFVGGHPAFGKWLGGDTLSGKILYIDSAANDEDGTPMLFRMESGPVKTFPQQTRISRADFDLVFGTGKAVNDVTMLVSGAASGNGGVVRLSVDDASRCNPMDVVVVSGVAGTTEANGTWQINVIDPQHIELIGSVYANAYTSGGTVIDKTAPPNMTDPQIAISLSKNGGDSWGSPKIRALGPQRRSGRSRVYVLDSGISGSFGDRWRLDVTDPVPVTVFGGVQSTDPRVGGV